MCTKFDGPSWIGSVSIVFTSFADRPIDRQTDGQTPAPYHNTSWQVRRNKMTTGPRDGFVKADNSYALYTNSLQTYGTQSLTGSKDGNGTSAGTFIWLHYKQNFVINVFVMGEVYCPFWFSQLGVYQLQPMVPHSPDARLSWAFVVRGFISIISKVKLQEKIQRLKFHYFNICPNILHADADGDTDARGIAIALLH